MESVHGEFAFPSERNWQAEREQLPEDVVVSVGNGIPKVGTELWYRV